MSEKSVLYITKHNPWGCGGGSTASLMYLSMFLKLFKTYRVDLCIADNIEIGQIPSEIIVCPNIRLIRVGSRNRISKLFSAVTGITHRYQSTAIQLIRANQYDYCVFDHSSIGGTLIHKLSKKTKSIVINHNFEPAYFADNTTNLLYRLLLLPAVRSCERQAYLNASFNLFLTEEDKNQFQAEYGTPMGQSLVTGLFSTKDTPDVYPVMTLQLKRPVVVITGSLDNIQNIDGIKYFANELYPHIPKDVTVIVAGKNPGPEIYSLLNGKPNIRLIPNPEDMRNVIRQGNIFLSPARLGSGIKVRVTDGLRGGLPVIAHEISSRGYAPYITAGVFRHFSTSEEFAQQLTGLIEDINKDKIKPNDIISLYKAHSSMDNVMYTIAEKLTDNV